MARSGPLLSHSVTPPQRGRCLSVPRRSPFTGADRAHADWLRARRLPAGLADAVGPLFAGPASGRSGDRRGIRRIRASDRLSAGRQPLWPQPLVFGPTPPLPASPQGRLVLLGASPVTSGSDPRRGAVRLPHFVPGRLFHPPPFLRPPPQYPPASPT